MKYLSIAILLVPVMLLLLSVLRVKGREQISSLSATLIWGGAVWLPMFFLEFLATIVLFTLFPEPSVAAAAVMAAAFALLSSSLQYMALYANTWNKRELAEPFDGMMYGAAVTLGYSFVEILFLLVNVLPRFIARGDEYLALRAMTTAPVLFFRGVMMGLFFVLAKRCPDDIPRRLLGAASILLSAAAGFAYEFLLIAQYDAGVLSTARFVWPCTAAAAVFSVLLFAGSVTLHYKKENK